MGMLPVSVRVWRNDEAFTELYNTTALEDQYRRSQSSHDLTLGEADEWMPKPLLDQSGEGNMVPR